MVSLTSTVTASLGPALLTVIVYVMGSLGCGLVVSTVLVMLRSAFATSVSLSVEELFPGTLSVSPAGNAAVAVLVSVPVASEFTVALTVYVRVPFAAIVAVLLMFPEPPAGHIPPLLAAQVGSVTGGWPVSSAAK